MTTNDWTIDQALLSIQSRLGADVVVIARRTEGRRHAALAALPRELQGPRDSFALFESLPEDGTITAISIAPSTVCAVLGARPSHGARVVMDASLPDVSCVVFWRGHPPDRATQDEMKRACEDLSRSTDAWDYDGWKRAGVGGLADIVDDLPLGVLFLDHEHLTLTANAEARRILGLPSATLAAAEVSAQARLGGWAVFDWNDPDGRVRDLLLGGRRYRIDAQRVRSAGRRGTAWTLMDITARTLLDQERATAKRAALMAEVAGGVGHEFNNLLARVICLAEDLQASGRSEETEEKAETLILTAEAGSLLVRRLMTYAQAAPVDLEVIDLAALVQAWAEAASDGPVRSASGPGETRVVADADLLRAVLDELAENARYAGARMIEAHWLVENSAQPVKLIVRDDGQGMTQDALHRATDPFFTTRPVGQGPGLGLSMVRGAIMRFGGDMNLESLPDAGLTVILTLPRRTPLITEARDKP